MDVSKLSPGQRIAGIAGGLLLIDMFLSWYSLNLPGGSEAQASRLGIDTSYSAWQAFGFIDIVMLVAIVAAIALAVVAVTGTKVDFPLATIAAGVGAVATVLVAYRILNEPGI